MKYFIIGNWKLNPTSSKKAIQLFNSIKEGINVKISEVVICPPFVYLPCFNSSKKISLGAQNCYWEEKGAFTGEISATMLKNLGCKYVILGHSERRRILKENSMWVNKKLRVVLSLGLVPILCFGETEEEKKSGNTQKVIRLQLKKGLKKIPKNKLKNILFAYEPIWAIGSGRPCRPIEANVVQMLVKKIISGIYGKSAAKDVNVLYGGSVNSKNALPYLKEAKLAGLLIGGASLKPKEFLKIVKKVDLL